MQRARDNQSEFLSEPTTTLETSGIPKSSTRKQKKKYLTAM
jgi:hypothetical protein